MNIHQVLDKMTDPINCNLKEQEVLKCYNELDNKWILKKRKYKKCLELDEIFKHCLVYANRNKMYKQEVYRGENVYADLYNKALEANSINKKNSLDYLSGKISEEDYLKQKNKKATKKLVEL
jgi:hypothetical protein